MEYDVKDIVEYVTLTGEIIEGKDQTIGLQKKANAELTAKNAKLVEKIDALEKRAAKAEAIAKEAADNAAPEVVFDPEHLKATAGRLHKAGLLTSKKSEENFSEKVAADPGFMLDLLDKVANDMVTVNQPALGAGVDTNFVKTEQEERSSDDFFNERFGR